MTTRRGARCWRMSPCTQNRHDRLQMVRPRAHAARRRTGRRIDLRQHALKSFDARVARAARRGAQRAFAHALRRGARTRRPAATGAALLPQRAARRRTDDRGRHGSARQHVQHEQRQRRRAMEAVHIDATRGHAPTRLRLGGPRADAARPRRACARCVCRRRGPAAPGDRRPVHAGRSARPRRRHGARRADALLR
jgi:hypothetical protein